MASTINASTSGVGGVITTADATGVLDLQTADVTRASVSSSGLKISRVDSSNEGGQLDLCRSSDNTSAWAIDVYGNTSTPSLRFVDNVAAASRLQIDGSGIITSPIGGVQVLSGTAVTASGTSIDFTSIPSWVKRITVMLSAVSTNGNANLRVQLGDSGGVETTGYSSMSGWIGASSASSGSSSGFDGYGDSGASTSRYGMYVFTTLGSNIWTCSAQYTSPNQNFIYCVSGGKTLSDVLDRVRITTSNGTDTFDAGSINILYE